MNIRKDITGQSFGRLTALRPCRQIPRKPSGLRTFWLCRCECGNEVDVVVDQLTRGKTKSCGCINDERTWLRKSRYGHEAEYTTWRTMIARCKPTHEKSKFYCDRDISVCDRWRQPGNNGFSAFLEDMGPKPSPKHTLDRIDPNKGYSPENCRWATMREQANNTRRNVVMEVAGERMTAAQIARRHDLNPSTVAQRIKKGWPFERVIERG